MVIKLSQSPTFVLVHCLEAAHVLTGADDCPGSSWTMQGVQHFKSTVCAEQHSLYRAAMQLDLKNKLDFHITKESKLPVFLAIGERLILL